MDTVSPLTQESVENQDGESPTQSKATSPNELSDLSPPRIPKKNGSQAPQEIVSDQAPHDAGEADIWDPMFQAAVTEMRRILPLLGIDEKHRQARLQGMLARVYLLSMEGMHDQARHRELLRRTHVKVRQDTPHHKQTLRAVMAEAGWKPPKGTEHEWAQVLTAFELDKVPETEPAVVKWLTDHAEVFGAVVSGFARAEAVVKNSQRLKDQRQAKKEEANAHDAGAFDALIQTAEQQQLGSIDVNEEHDPPDGLWLSLNSGTSVLAPLKIKPDELRKLVLKYGHRG